jgi:hypothetical protein
MTSIIEAAAERRAARARAEAEAAAVLARAGYRMASLVSRRGSVGDIRN